MSAYYIVNEISRIRSIEQSVGVKIPLPHFFYIQKFGRKIDEQMPEILALIGKKKWFLFQTGQVYRKEGLLSSLLLELEKHTDPGREYQECVVIEIEEDICKQGEWTAFLEYLQSKEDQFYFLFTMKQTKNMAFVQQGMERYFFLRTIGAEAYKAEEQLDIIRRHCEKCGFTLDNADINGLYEKLSGKEWKENEWVARKLQTAVYHSLYRIAIGGNVEQNMSQKIVTEVLEYLDRIPLKEKAIGFCQEDNSYE